MKSELKKPNEIIMTRTPLKMSFFGGGTDLPDFSQKYGGCVVATAIDRYLYVVIREREDSTITLDTPFGHETCSTAASTEASAGPSHLRKCNLPVSPRRREEGITVWFIPLFTGG